MIAFEEMWVGGHLLVRTEAVAQNRWISIGVRCFEWETIKEGQVFSLRKRPASSRGYHQQQCGHRRLRVLQGKLQSQVEAQAGYCLRMVLMEEGRPEVQAWFGEMAPTLLAVPINRR